MPFVAADAVNADYLGSYAGIAHILGQSSAHYGNATQLKMPICVKVEAILAYGRNPVVYGDSIDGTTGAAGVYTMNVDWLGSSPTYGLYQTGQTGACFDARHASRANFTYMDGSAGSLSVTDFMDANTKAYRFRPYRYNGVWNL